MVKSDDSKWSKWAFRAYCRLWLTHKQKNITFDDIEKTLGLDGRSVGVILSELKKAGWVSSKPHPDRKRFPRKKVYKLQAMDKVISDIAAAK